MNNNMYAADGNTVIMTQVNDFVMTGGKSFKTTSGLIEIAQTTNVTSGTGAGTTALTKTYYNFGAIETRAYGIINTSTVMGFSISATVSFDPAMPWQTNPALNTPYTNTFTVLTEASGLPTTSQARTETRTYSAEQITTLAGTFAACKIKTDETTNGTTVTSYSWQVGSGRLKGHTLKQTNAAGVRTMEATALQVNGS
jgi:hypothetical protein